jgi:cytochrome P450
VSTQSRGWPLLGDWVAFHWNPPRFLLRIAREQGDVARFRLGRSDAVLLSHPDLIRAVLVDRAADFTKGHLMQRARRLLGDGLLTSEGEAHRGRRRRIQPAFTRDRVREYGALAATLAARRSAHWQKGRQIRVDAEMDAITMGVVAAALLGADLEDDLPSLAAALRLLARWSPLLAAPGGGLLERTRLPLLGRIRAALELLDDVIERRVVTHSEKTPLMAALRDEGDPMSPRQIRDEVMTIFLAGHDTTAATLTWIWLFLSAYPAVDARLRRELGEVLGERDPVPDDLDRLVYTDMVVKETLRLYPPIGRIGRRPARGIELDGVTLERDMPVFLSPFVTQRDPRWFEEPDRFWPERWGDAAVDRPKFAWFPFGAGPRSCIGESFARAVIPLVVATVAQRWRLRALRATLPLTRPLLTLKPRGTVWMIVEPSPTPSPHAVGSL